jgi:hypothetical protein
MKYDHAMHELVVHEDIATPDSPAISLLFPLTCARSQE